MEMTPEVENNLIHQARQMKRPIPERIRNKPRLILGLELYYDSFWDLTTEREFPQPIPWSSITQYCSYYGFSMEESEEFRFFINQIDAEYLKLMSKKNGV